MKKSGVPSFIYNFLLEKIVEMETLRIIFVVEHQLQSARERSRKFWHLSDSVQKFKLIHTASVL